MLKEPDEISTKRKRIRETLKVLQQAYRVIVFSRNALFLSFNLISYF